MKTKDGMSLKAILFIVAEVVNTKEILSKAVRLNAAQTELPSASRAGFCFALSSACSQSVGHPADTILAPFTRVCWPQPAFVVCILNAQQRGIPFGPVVSWNKPSATAPIFTWPEERGRAQIKWIHELNRPQQRIHSFCHPAADRITHKTFLWVPPHNN